MPLALRRVQISYTYLTSSSLKTNQMVKKNPGEPLRRSSCARGLPGASLVPPWCLLGASLVLLGFAFWLPVPFVFLAKMRFSCSSPPRAPPKRPKGTQSCPKGPQKAAPWPFTTLTQTLLQFSWSNSPGLWPRGVVRSLRYS